MFVLFGLWIKVGFAFGSPALDSSMKTGPTLEALSVNIQLFFPSLLILISILPAEEIRLNYFLRISTEKAALTSNGNANPEVICIQVVWDGFKFAEVVSEVKHEERKKDGPQDWPLRDRLTYGGS